jgi:chromosome segregation ATPase
VLSQAQQQVDQAERALAAHDARNAIAAAQAASETGKAIANALATFGAIRMGIAQSRNDAEELEAKGYRMEASRTALDGAEVALAKAATALQTRPIAEAQAALQATQVMLDEAIANGRDLPKTQAENERRLPELEAQGTEIANLIAEGRKTFDKVDDFAESTWNDIRGNGSEAQAAADRAHQRWLSAQERNTMDRQEFLAAKADLDKAAEELNYARMLINAITQRLQALEKARDTSREELDDALHDIKAGWEFIRSKDADVGRDPEQQLRQAEQLLTQAQNQAQQPKPDWLALVRYAQQANQLADTALVSARSEFEQTDKLRSQARRAQQLATAEVQKIVQFLNVHQDDIQEENQRAIDQIQRQVQQSFGLLQQAEQSEDQARRKAYQAAFDSYTTLQTNADQVYQRVHNDFLRLEGLRAQLNQELNGARHALSSAETTYSALRGDVSFQASPVQQLRRARQAFDSIKLPITGEANLQRTVQLARGIRQEARDAEQELRRLANRNRPGSGGSGDVLTGMIIGSILDSASSSSSRSGGWGGSGGGGSSSGGGGWGGFGGGGGSWGGGGGSGGSWGGGGGSGGGW